MFESKRVRMRAWRDEDRAPFARMNADPQVMEFLGPLQTQVESDAGVDRQIALMEKGEPCFWAAERIEDGAFMGFIGVKRFTFEAPFTPGYEIGWRLAREFWGKGYAPEGAAAALAHCFAKYGMPHIDAITTRGNVRSQSVMKKIGMTYVEGQDFQHPNVPPDSPISSHVLYRIVRPG
jgi:ribosomal-protein-alanine N-acetyltransferase